MIQIMIAGARPAPPYNPAASRTRRSDARDRADEAIWQDVATTARSVPGVTRAHESVFSQERAGIRFEWGMEGAAAVSSPRAALVVVDVLSFSTATTIAVAKGITVYPHHWPSAEVEQFAVRHGAACAVRRHRVDGEHPWSLSPTHLMAAPHVDRLVLPSPNGSAIAAEADAGVVLIGSLRNASAVGRWLKQEGFGTVERPVVVIAAGERWGSGALRPAVEDLVGAGAVIASFETGYGLSPEAVSARASWQAVAQRLPETLKVCTSGLRLAEAGYASDVLLAADRDVESVVPVLVDGAFRSAEAHNAAPLREHGRDARGE